jgi:hypothetical protein
VSLLKYILAFALQLRKSTENISQGSRAATVPPVAPTWLSFEGQPRLACSSVTRRTSVGTSAFRVAQLRGSPHQPTLRPNCRSVLSRRLSSLIADSVTPSTSDHFTNKMAVRASPQSWRQHGSAKRCLRGATTGRQPSCYSPQ